MRTSTAKKRKVDPRKTILRELGQRVRERRAARGITQQQLAEELDLSVAYVSLIERGQRNPAYTTVAALAGALGARAGDLAG